MLQSKQSEQTKTAYQSQNAGSTQFLPPPSPSPPNLGSSRQNLWTWYQKWQNVSWGNLRWKMWIWHLFSRSDPLSPAPSNLFGAFDATWAPMKCLTVFIIGVRFRPVYPPMQCTPPRVGFPPFLPSAPWLDVRWIGTMIRMFRLTDVLRNVQREGPAHPSMCR